MEYNYEQEYQKVVQQGEVILNKAKQDYKSMAAKYNEKTLQEETGKLLYKVNNELLEIKGKFLEEAQAQLEANKKEVIDSKAFKKANKDKQEAMLELLTLQSTVEEFKADLILSNEEEFTELLKEIDDPKVFKICKAFAIQQASKDIQNKIRTLQYVDPEVMKIDMALMQVKHLDMQMFSPILSVKVNNVEEYITGKQLSNYYFGGDK